MDSNRWPHELAADMDHAARRLEKAGFADMVARLFSSHDPANSRKKLRIAFAAMERARKVVVGLRKKARPHLAVGG